MGPSQRSPPEPPQNVSPHLVWRGVKRNAFPPSLLKLKHDDCSFIRKRSSISGRSLSDLTRIMGLFIKRAGIVTPNKNGIRRPRSRRRRDWQCAMSSMVPADKQSQKILHGLPWPFSLPVLPVILLRDTCFITSSTSLPIRITVRPRKRSVVANLHSNMWFDTEILARETASIFPTPKQSKNETERYLASCLEELGIETDTHPGIAAIKTSLETMRPIEKPIFEATNFNILMWGNERSLRQKCGPDGQIYVCSEAAATLLSLKERRSPCLAKSTEFLFEELRGNVNNAIHSIHAQVKAIQGNGKSQQMNEGDTWRSAYNFLKEPAVMNKAILHPITRKGPLHYPMKSFPLMAPSRKSSNLVKLKPTIAHLTSLLPFIRRWLSIELGQWNPGPREIILKSKYSWNKILQSIPALNLDSLFVTGHSLPECQQKSQAPVAPVNGLIYLNNFLDHVAHMGNGDFLINGKWKKFLIALEKELRDESVRLHRRRIHHLRTQIFSFDPPARVPCPTSSVPIKSMYGTSCRKSTDAAVILEGFDTPAKRSSSQQTSESTLSIFDNAIDIYEDRDMEETLGALVGLHSQQSTAEKISGVEITNNVVNDPHNVGDRMLDERNQKNLNSPITAREVHLEQNPSGRPPLPSTHYRQVTFHPPHNLMCAPWSLKVAEFCIREMQRGTIFLPPPLSMLPSLAAIAHSYTSASLCDYRVLIVCEANTQMMSTLHAYLDLIYDGTVSIESVRRKDRESAPSLATLSSTLARIVITDSFDFTAIPDFAVLLILGPGTQSLFSVAEGSLTHSGENDGHISPWAAIPSILIMPYHQCNWVQSYFSNATRLASLLGIDEALVIDECDDVLVSVLLSRPDFIFLVPSLEVIEFLAILETHASDSLRVYSRILQQQRGSIASEVEANRLADIQIDVLEAILSAGDYEGQKLDKDLYILFALRQARSYALYDGNRTAIEFLKHYVQEVLSASPDVFESLFEKVQEKSLLNADADGGFHPMTSSLKKSLDEMGRAMKKEAPSLRKIHRHQVFRPLIITNSGEACEAFLKEIPGAVDICEAQEGDVAICVSRDLQASGGRNQTLNGYAKNTREAIPQFSHVLHILDDRKPVAPGQVLPPELLQRAFCGKARLVTVAVDESRSLDIVWKRNENQYSSICKVARAARQLNKEKKDYNLLHIHQSVITSLNLTEPVIPAQSTPTRDSQPTFQSDHGARNSRLPTRQTHAVRKSHIICSKGDEHAEYQITVGQILRQSMSSLRAKLKSALQSVLDCSGSCRYLRVVVKAADTEKWTPALTSILAAVAGDKSLYQYVDVHVG